MVDSKPQNLWKLIERPKIIKLFIIIIFFLIIHVIVATTFLIFIIHVESSTNILSHTIEVLFLEHHPFSCVLIKWHQKILSFLKFLFPLSRIAKSNSFSSIWYLNNLPSTPVIIDFVLRVAIFQLHLLLHLKP